MTALDRVAVASLGWAVVGLAVGASRAWRRRTPAVRAAAAGPAWRGIAYVFGPGMSPRAKESASEHPIVYALGLAYHAAIFSALLAVALLLLGVAIPSLLSDIAIVLLAAGIASGVALLVRRARSPLLRAISAPDDYASNLIVTVWLLASADALAAGRLTSPVLATSIVLGIYAPTGKIRHCIFFFLSRAVYGARLGRRGLAGPAARAVTR